MKFGGFGKSGKAKEVSGPLELTIISYFCNLRSNVDNLVSKAETNNDELVMRMTPANLFVNLGRLSNNQNGNLRWFLP